MNQDGIVLIVDDEPVGLEVVRALFHNTNYTLHFASNGKEAIAKAQQFHPDIILLDVIMPGMSGYEVCRAIRELPDLSDVPIILLTALNDRDAKIQGIQAGADDFISKPFDRLELTVRVRTILRLNRYRRLMGERTKFAWVVESADDGYLIVDAHDTILYANPRAHQMISFPNGHDYSSLPTFRALAKRHYQFHPDAAWRKWPSLSKEQRNLVQPRSSESPSRWLQVDVLPETISQQQNYLIRLRDVTEDVEKQRITWTFHAQIQHKFRHPLSTLMGYLDLLNEDAKANTFDEQQKVLVQRAYHSGVMLSQEILTVLNYLSMGKKNRTPTKQNCSLSEAQQLLGQAQKSFPTLAIKLKSDLGSADNFLFNFSADTWQMMIWELIENARKFHPAKTPSISISLRRLGDMAILIVEDDGLHLSPDLLEKMWSPYYQGEPYFTGQIPGMGLGLAMIAEAVWSSGGQCASHNRSDRPGVVVELTLPLIYSQS